MLGLKLRTDLRTAASSNGRIGANLTTQGTLDLTDSTINANLYGIQLAGASSAILNNTHITTTLSNAHGINLATSSTVTMIGGSITTRVFSFGLLS
jgi:hypothetical protein